MGPRNGGQGKKPQQKPQPKRRPAPKAAPARRRNQGAMGPRVPQTRLSFSPLSTSIIPVARSCGTGLSVSGLVSSELTHSVGDRTLFIVNNYGSSGTIMLKITRPSSGATPSKTTYTVPLLDSPASVGGPTSGRSMKAGISILNNTPQLTAGGRCYIIDVDQRMAIPDDLYSITATEFDSFLDKLKGHVNRIPFDGATFKPVKHFHTHVADAVQYETFNTWVGTDTVSGFGSHMFEYPGTPDPTKKSMSTLLVILESPAATQEYTITARGQWMTRWPLDTIGGFVSKDIPTATPAVVDSALKAGQRSAGPGTGTGGR